MKYKSLIGYGVVAVAVAALSIGATWTYANLTATTINACVSKIGTVRILADGAPVKCFKTERLLSWNMMGPKGDIGPVGPQGEQGPQGEMGPQGEKGSASKEIYVIDAQGIEVGLLVDTELDPQEFTGDVTVYNAALDAITSYDVVTGNESSEHDTALNYESSDCTGAPLTVWNFGIRHNRVLRVVGNQKGWTHAMVDISSIREDIAIRSVWDPSDNYCRQLTSSPVFENVGELYPVTPSSFVGPLHIEYKS